MDPTTLLQRIGVTQGAAIGAIVGALFGAWTLASRPPIRIAPIVTASPPASPACPAEYARSPGLDASAAVENTRARWLARCDPRTSQAALSESLELFWSNELIFDPTVRGETLEDFTRAVAHGGSLALETPRHLPDVTVHGLPAAVMDVDGAYRLPQLAVRVWILPVGASTLQVTLVAPRERANAATASAREAIANTQGLRPYANEPAGSTTEPATARGFHVQVACPAGFSDATPAHGGPSANLYVGRYCLLPDDQGGAELTFAELPVRADQPPFVRRLFELAAQSTAAVGVAIGAGFGPTESVHVGNVEGATAEMEVSPPPARVRLHAMLAPAINGTLYALSIATPDHADAARDALTQWVTNSALVHAPDPAIISDYRRTQTLKVILAPAVITALLGAFLAWRLQRSLAKP